MRLLAVLLLSLASAAGCTSAGHANVDTPMPSASSATPQLPVGAAGKIAAAQVGKLSPVPAFEGGGSDWQIEIKASGDLVHDVKLYWGGHAQSAGGTVYYDRLRNPAAPGTIVLDGKLHTGAGDAAMTIVILRRDCVDASGHAYPHGVDVTVAGMAPLQGCGELAMY